MVLVFQLQLTQPFCWIAVGDDAHHLGITGLFLGQILDALAGSHALRDAFGIGVDAISRDLTNTAIAVHMIVIRIDLGADAAVDGQIGHLCAAVVNIHLAQRLFL